MKPSIITVGGFSYLLFMNCHMMYNYLKRRYIMAGAANRVIAGDYEGYVAKLFLNGLAARFFSFGTQK
jgi:hypothetical protein